MYLTPATPTAFYDEVSFIFRALNYPDNVLCYWATQIDFVKSDNSSIGGCHFGPQQASNFPNFSPVNRTGINWGGYITGAGTMRGSLSTTLSEASGPNTLSYEIYPDRDYFFRIFKSPKQNYLAAELDTDGTGTGNQAANEIAWRCTVIDLSTGIETFIRDLLVPDCKTGVGAITSAVMWSEDFNAPDPATTTPPTTATPWYVRFSEPRFNKRLAPTGTVTYGSQPNYPVNVNLGVDKSGYSMVSVVTKTVVAGTVLTHPGPVVRSYSSAVDFNSVPSLTIPEPLGAASTDLLVCAIMTDVSRGMQELAGWTLRSIAPASHGRARLHIYHRIRGSGAPSYTFLEAVDGGLCGGILAVFGADNIAPPLIGTPGESASPNDIWTAPALNKDTNYGRVLYVASRSFDGTQLAGFSVPAGCRELVDTGDTNTDWVKIALGQEVLMSSAGATAVKSAPGPNGGGSQAVQMMVYPPLQRVGPSADLSVGTWAVAPLFSKVNGAPNEATWISGPNGAVCTLTLPSGLGDPLTGVGHVVRYRCRRQNADTASLTVDLLEGATVRATKVETIPAGDAWLSGALTLTTAQADAIVDYSALRLRLTAG